MGHYSAGFTIDTYTHVTSDMQRDAAQKMGELHGPGDVKIQRKNGGSTGPSSLVLPRNFLVWVLFGSDAEQQKLWHTKPEQKQAKSPDFNGNQKIFGRSVIIGLKTKNKFQCFSLVNKRFYRK